MALTEWKLRAVAGLQGPVVKTLNGPTTSGASHGLGRRQLSTNICRSPEDAATSACGKTRRSANINLPGCNPSQSRSFEHPALKPESRRSFIES